MRPPRENRRSRRAFLAALGSGTAAIAGCIGSDSESRAGSRQTTERYPVVRRSIGETYETDSGLSVTVRNPRLRKPVVIEQHTNPVLMAPDSQTMVVDVVTDGPIESVDRDARPRSSTFQALTDGTIAGDESAPLDEDFHPAETGRSTGVFVPVAPADEASVAWARRLPKSVVWSLPDDVVSGLDTAPSYTVDDVRVSDETNPQVTLTVSNTGGRDGTFYANVSGSQVQDDNDVIGFRVSAGETVTHSDRPGIDAPAGEETRVTLNWGLDEIALAINPE